MKRALFCLSFLFTCTAMAQSQAMQQPVVDPRSPLTEQVTAYDAAGRAALAGRLRATEINGAIDSPIRSVRLVVTNSGPFFYEYATGWATFYDGDGVRCGEGLFKVSALAPGESAEVDTPGARITCTPTTWRIMATNLLTPTAETAKPSTPAAPAPGAGVVLGPSAVPVANPADSTMIISINGQDHPIQLGKPMVLTNAPGSLTIVLKRR